MRFSYLLFSILSSTAQARVVQIPPLIQAVRGEHMPLIRQLVRGGTEVNTIDAWRRTAAHYAVSNNNLPALKLLLKNGADVNLADNDGNTPLDLWHEHKDEEMLKLLHAAGTKPLDLWQAAANNDRLSAERLLAAGADAKVKNDAGKVPFEIAVEAEHYALAAILAKAAGGIDGRDEKGWRPLHWAILSDDWGLVREFIREGADIGADRRQSVFDVATLMKSETKLIEIFIAEKGVDATVGRYLDPALIWAVKKKYMDIFKHLLDNNADLNIQNSMGNTTLVEAVRWERMEIVKLLIDNGADLNIQNDIGNTVLIFSVREGKTKIVKLLIDNGADLNIQNNSGNTALMLAVSSGHTEAAKLLIDNKADLNNKNMYGQTALTDAASSGHTKAAKLLIDNKADLNIKTNCGNTALMRAASSGHTEIVKLLIDNKADLNIKNSNDESALDIAEKKGHQEIIDILRAAQQGSI